MMTEATEAGPQSVTCRTTDTGTFALPASVMATLAPADKAVVGLSRYNDTIVTPSPAWEILVLVGDGTPPGAPLAIVP
jgi:hypothetical protein